MDLSQCVEPITILKTKCAEIISRMRQTRQPVAITQNGKVTAVIQDVQSYQKEKEALLLLKFLAQGERELMAGKGIAHNKVKKRILQNINKVDDA